MQIAAAFVERCLASEADSGSFLFSLRSLRSFAAIQIGLSPAGVAAVDDQVASGKESGGIGG
jgi:hypothetical protein